MMTICYETKTGETYLSYYTYKNAEEAEREVKKLNETKPERLWNGEKVDWTKVKKFFTNEQEEMY